MNIKKILLAAATATVLAAGAAGTADAQPVYVGHGMHDQHVDRHFGDRHYGDEPENEFQGRPRPLKTPELRTLTHL